MRTLCIDIGGTGIKAMILDAAGAPLSERTCTPTPKPAVPEAVLGVIAEDAAKLGEYDRISVGFPGVVRDGVTKTAPNLHADWADFPLADEVARRHGDKPTRVLNDAAIQGLGVISGKGLEAAITLGTGLGCCLYVNGKPWPVELGHHPYRKGKEYEHFIGDGARKEAGNKRWKRRVKKAIETIGAIFNYDTLYIGGGNARFFKSDELPENVRLVDNSAGLVGGLRLWD